MIVYVCMYATEFLDIEESVVGRGRGLFGD